MLAPKGLQRLVGKYEGESMRLATFYKAEPGSPIAAVGPSATAQPTQQTQVVQMTAQPQYAQQQWAQPAQQQPPARNHHGAVHGWT